MNLKQIGQTIQARRKELKITQTQLAEKAQLSVVHVSHIETRKVSMSLDSLLAICSALEVTPNDILLGEYVIPNLRNLLFEKPSENISFDDKILLQNIYRYMEERNGNPHKNKEKDSE